jgi:hypothetical protein
VVSRLDLLAEIEGCVYTPARPRLDPRVGERLAECLNLIERAVAGFAASEEPLPHGLARFLRRRHKREAQRELHHVSALLSRLLAPVGLP